MAFNKVWTLGGLLSALAILAWLGLELFRSGGVPPLVLPPLPTAQGAAITPVPVPNDLDPARVALGERLFHDTRLSHDDTVSCAHCHPLDRGGADGLPHSVGIGGQVGSINAPTVFNSALNFAQFWDGRAPTLEDQVNGPVNNPVEMGSNWPEVLGKLRADSSYVEQFGRIYPDGITAANVRDAIATFERSLNTPGSAFDRWLQGDPSAITDRQQRGYRLFLSYGCVACHQGAALGGNMYERIGVFEPYPPEGVPVRPADLGRFNVTGVEEHRFEFKVPGLRNVALTAPYFHDGSAATLEQAVLVMGRHQLGVDIPDDDVRDIAEFLRSLTGQYRGRPL